MSGRLDVLERVILVSPRGPCAGVIRAIATVEDALATDGPPVYVRRAIVHNAHVVARLAAAGAVFVDELDAVPRGSVVVFSAHGVTPAVHEQAERRGLRVLDATCPLVSKVHHEVRRFADRGLDVVVVGHAGHDEIVGTLGQVPGIHLAEPGSDLSSLRVADPRRVACVTQTTLNADELDPVLAALRRRFPTLVEPASPDVCYATRNRQAAVAWLAGRADVVLVVGDPASSNSRRLCDVARVAGTPAYRLGDVTELDESWLIEARVVGVSAGASTPDELVGELVDHLCLAGAVLDEEVLFEEHIAFALPAGVSNERPRETDPRSPGRPQGRRAVIATAAPRRRCRRVRRADPPPGRLSSCGARRRRAARPR